MVQLRSIINSADNSGAKKLMVIGILKKGNKKTASIGDVVTAVVKKAIPTGMVKTHDIVKAVIVRTKKEIRRKDGSYIRFDDNAGVIIDNLQNKNPKGTRIIGPVARELKEANFSKIVSMAEEVY